MANLPRFVFPPANGPEVLDSTFTTRKARPQIQLNTDADAREGYRLTVPTRRHSRPVNLRTVSTPPDSPTRMRSSTIGSHDPVKMHDSGALTPPATPTSASHSKSNSSSSDFLSSLSSLRRGDSLSSYRRRSSIDEPTSPENTELITYPHHLIDYTISLDEKDRKKPIGSGAWSDVYLATPSLPQLAEQASIPTMTPPLTPAGSRKASTSESLPSIPRRYAVKTPASTSAKKVLEAEARVLSYLSQYPSSSSHMVSFFGQDTRDGSLVLEAMDMTLEDWILTNFNNILDPTSRTNKLAAIFPKLALSLIDSMNWLHDKECIHADIKPSNILVAQSPFNAVFSDFSSSILPSLDAQSTPGPMGAGTWDFLDPSLLSSLNPATPCEATDLWSLAITLLYIILGASPFETFRHNKFQFREMVKSGSPLQCIGYDAVALARLKDLSRALGWDVGKWFGMVLAKKKENRVDVEKWRAELTKIMRVAEAKM